MIRGIWQDISSNVFTHVHFAKHKYSEPSSIYFPYLFEIHILTLCFPMFLYIAVSYFKGCSLFMCWRFAEVNILTVGSCNVDTRCTNTLTASINVFITPTSLGLCCYHFYILLLVPMYMDVITSEQACVASRDFCATRRWQLDLLLRSCVVPAKDGTHKSSTK